MTSLRPSRQPTGPDTTTTLKSNWSDLEDGKQRWVPAVAERRLEDIDGLIDRIQTGLVELFDLFRELRRQLHIASAAAGRGARSVATGQRETAARQPGVAGTASQSRGNNTGSHPETTRYSTQGTRGVATPPISRKTLINKVLDMFARHVEAADAVASVLARELERARATLITPEYPNESVAGDMAIVLRFLRARGERGIRPQERDNILQRIHRWKMHLIADATRGQ